MKTSQEIINELHEAIKTLEPKQHHFCFVIALTNLEEREKQSQLDAFKAGMSEAETKLQLVPNPFGDDSQRPQNYGAKWMCDAGSKAILTARDNKTSV